MRQTELNLGAELKSPYNGKFWCWYRQEFFTWPEYISWFKNKGL